MPAVPTDQVPNAGVTSTSTYAGVASPARDTAGPFSSADFPVFDRRTRSGRAPTSGRPSAGTSRYRTAPVPVRGRGNGGTSRGLAGVPAAARDGTAAFAGPPDAATALSAADPRVGDQNSPVGDQTSPVGEPPAADAGDEPPDNSAGAAAPEGAATPTASAAPPAVSGPGQAPSVENGATAAGGGSLDVQALLAQLCLLVSARPAPPPLDDGGSAPARDPADVGGGGDGSSAGAGGDRGPVDYRADYNSFPPSAHSVFDPPHDAYVSDEEFQRRRAEIIDDICAANGFPAHPLPPLGAAGAASVGEPGVDRAAHARRVAVDYFLLGRPGQFPVATPADWACDGRLRPFDDPVVAQRLNHQVDYGYQGGKSEVFLNVREKYLAATSAMVVIQLTVQHLQQCLADLAYSPHILTEAGQRLCVSLLRALHVQKQLYDGFLKRVSRVRILVTHGKQAAAAIDAHDPFDSHIRAGGLDADSQRLLAQYIVEEGLRKRKAATRRTTGRSNDSSRSKPSASAGSSNRGGGKGATRAAAPGAAAAGKG